MYSSTVSLTSVLDFYAICAARRMQYHVCISESCPLGLLDLDGGGNIFHLNTGEFISRHCVSTKKI